MVPLSGLGSAEVRTRDGVRRVAIHPAAETIKVGRARGHEVEPIWGITAQCFVDASEGRAMADVERDMAERAKELAGGRSLLLQDVTRVPPGTLKPDPRNLEPLVAMLPR